MPEPIVVLTPDAARRVSRAVQVVEGLSVAPAPRRIAPLITAPSRFALTTSTITAGDATAGTLGSGTASLQLIASTTSGGTTAYGFAAMPGPVSVTVLNGGAEIAPGRLIQVKVIDGFFVCDVDYC
jgi:hypothetical protein